MQCYFGITKVLVKQEGGFFQTTKKLEILECSHIHVFHFT